MRMGMRHRAWSTEGGHGHRLGHADENNGADGAWAWSSKEDVYWERWHRMVTGMGIAHSSGSPLGPRGAATSV